MKNKFEEGDENILDHDEHNINNNINEITKYRSMNKSIVSTWKKNLRGYSQISKYASQWGKSKKNQEEFNKQTS